MENDFQVKAAPNGIYMLPVFEGKAIDEEEFEKLMKEASCYFVNEDEREKLKTRMFDPEKSNKLRGEIAGQSPKTIAEWSGFEVPENTKVIVVAENGVGDEYPFSKEKLSPVLAYYVVDGKEEGIALADKLIRYAGMGHSAVIHSEDKQTK